ncbi:MAG: VCBS repeat-containing protein, partial [Reichenbachiella sp.]
MNSYRKIIVLLSLIFIARIGMAQDEEICSNDIDDDDDQFIDCYDSDCSGDANCLQFYFGNDVICQDPPTEFPSFAMKELWGSDNLTAQNSSTPAIGDINGDGTPNVVVTNRISDRLSILNGATGVTENQISLNFDVAKTVAIANVNDFETAVDEDDANCSWIFVRGFSGRQIRAYDCNLVEQWSINLASGRKRANILSIADFNQDGIPELLSGNEIRNARTGAQIVAGTGNFRTEVMYGTVAVDILDDDFCTDCSGLEIVDGANIWAVNIGAGTKTLALDMNTLLPSGSKFFPKYYSGWTNQWSMVSVADFDIDGNLDVLMTGAQGSSYNDPTTAFFWDVAGNNVYTYTDDAATDPDGTNDHSRGTGRINVGGVDFDNDGVSEMVATYVSNQKLYCLDADMNLRWAKDIKEGSSGFTGCTIFDFNGDGDSEIVYRSESTLHIIRGTDGETFSSRVCISRTYEDYPLVADVDGDGASEICVSCSTNDSQPFNPYSNSDNGHIRIFEADGESWQPARPVWNQHAYFNVNVNDNLTIPTAQQNHSKVFSENICTVGPNRPLNVFLNQAPYLNETGCPNYVAPDVSVVNGGISTTTPECPSTLFDVTLAIANTGDIGLAGQLPITFYDGDPTLATSTKLNTAVATISNFDVGETQNITVQAQGPGDDFTLFISVNDNGSQDPPINLFIGSIPECDDTNNFASIDVGSVPVDLTAEKIKNDIRCFDTYPPNGAGEAYYFGTIDATLTEVWDEDFDDLASGTSDDDGDTEWSRTFPNASGTYAEVRASSGNNEFTFNRTINEAVWTSEVIDISGMNDVDLTMTLRSSGPLEDADYLRAYYKLNGENELSLENGLQVNDFGTVIAGLPNPIEGNTLQIVVRAQVSWTNEFFYIDDILVTSLTDAITGAITNDYTFYWYDAADPNTVVYTGDTYPDMEASTYNVYAESISNGCVSNTVPLVIENEENDPVVVIKKNSDLTDCANPDGELEAVVMVDGEEVTEGYSFTWYVGSDVGSPVSLESIADELSVRSYTVEVIDDKSGCVTTENESIISNTITPIIEEVSTTNILVCNNLNGGSLEVSGESGEIEGYTYNWYIGDEVTFTPDHTGDGIDGFNVYSGLSVGNYTVELIDKSTGCTSAALPLSITDISATPPVTVTINQENLNCEGQGSGIASATSDGETSGFTFEWFEGDNTITALTTVSGTSSETVNSLNTGVHTVRVTETATSCSFTDTFTISSVTTDPEIDDSEIIVSSVSVCNAVGTDNGIINATNALVISGDGTDGMGNPLYLNASTNGSFEFPDISEAPYNEPGGTVDDIPMADVPFWSTAANKKFIQLMDNGYVPNNSAPYTAYDGNQWCEVNAQQKGSLYYDLVTTPGAEMTWSFAHRSRGGSDEVEVEIGEAGSEVFQASVTSSDEKWFFYSGTYTVPAGQTSTRFLFNAISPSGIVGNFVDAVSFEPADHTYNLYEGTNSNGTPYETNLTGLFEDLAPGNYTLQIVNNLTLCESLDELIVVDALEDAPVITKGTKVDDDFCGANGNGSQEITAAAAPGVSTPFYGYSFELFDAHNTDPSNSVEGPKVSLNFTDLSGTFTPGETFSVTAVGGTPKTGTFSSVDGSTFWITDYSAPFNFADSMMTGDISGATAKVTAFGGVQNLTYTGLTNGNYRVEVTSLDTDCAEVEDFVIDDIEVTPTFQSSSATANSNCSGANNGKAIVFMPGGSEDEYTFTWYPGDEVDVGNEIKEDVQGGTGNDGEFIDGLAEGYYTVVATNIASGCPSNPLPINIPLQKEDPVVTIVQVDPQTACIGGAPNGSLRAYVTDAANFPGDELIEGDGYTFAWFLGEDTSVPLAENSNPTGINESDPVGVDFSTISGLDAQVGAEKFTVQVTRTSTGCTNTATFTLANEAISPVVTNISSTADTGCNSASADGAIAITATIDGNAVDFSSGEYTVAIFDDADASYNNAGLLVIDNTDGTIENIESGNYTVTVEHTATNCTSDPEGFTLASNPDNPGILMTDANATENTVCDLAIATNYDGVITATIDGGADPALYNYSWYIGQNTSDAVNNTDMPGFTTTTNGTNDAILLSNVPGGIYTLEVEEIFSGCTGTQEYTLGTNTVTPGGAGAVNVATTLDHVEQCDGGNAYPDGSITVTTIDGNDATDYTYVWYHGNSVDADSILVVDNTVDIFDASNKNITRTNLVDIDENTVGTTVVLSGINEGAYTFVATSKTTGCPSDPVNVEILNNPNTIAAVEDATAGANVDNTVCALTADVTEYDGKITAVLTGSTDLDVNNYTWEWFEGLNDDTAVDASADDGTKGILDLIPAGDYTVRLTHITSNCSELISFSVDDATTTPGDGAGFVTSLDHVEQCDGGNAYPDGGITVTTIDGNDATNYSYDWYHGNSVDADSILIVDNTVDIFDASNKNITRTNLVDIDENTVGTTVVLSGINEGAYTFVATSKTTGCPSDPVIVTILDNSTSPTLSTTTIDHNGVCSAEDLAVAADPNVPDFYDGSIVVTVPAGTYNYSWYAGGVVDDTQEIAVDVNLGADITTDGTLDRVPAGTYTLRLENDDTKCFDDFTFSITDEDIVNPEIVTADGDGTDYNITNVSGCQGATAPAYVNGAIQLVDIRDSTATTVTAGEFSYQWYFGASVIADSLLANGENILARKGKAYTTTAVITGADSEHIANLDEGQYTVVITDVKTGCPSDPQTFTIDNETVAPTAGVQIDRIQYSCDDSAPTGQLTAFETTIGNLTGYTFAWYTGSSVVAANLITTNLSGTHDETVSNLSAGTYTVLVTNDLTKCTGTFTEIIEEEEPTIAATFNAKTAQTTCNSTGTDGSITIDLTTTFVGAGTGWSLNGGYTVQWYLGENTNDPLNDGDQIAHWANVDYTADVANPTATTSTTISDLPGGWYTVVVTDDITGCDSEPLSVEVVETLTAIDIVFDMEVENTDCADEIGSVRATASGGTGSFTFEWYEGTSNFADSAWNEPGWVAISGDGATNSPILDSDNPLITPTGSTISTLSQVQSFAYTVVAIDATTGCRYQESYDIGYVDQQQTAALTILDVTTCNPDNGTAQVELDGADADPITTSDNIGNYMVFLYVGSGFPQDTTDYYKKANGSNAVTAGTMISNDLNGVILFEDLPAGTYTAIARQKTAFNPSQCFTEFQTDAVGQLAFDPLINNGDDIVTPNSVCDVGLNATGEYNGSIQITPSKDDDENAGSGDQFKFRWFTGADTTSFIAGSETTGSMATLNELEDGQYTVAIYRMALASLDTDGSILGWNTGALNGCVEIKSYNVTENLSTPTWLDDPFLDPQTMCNPNEDGIIRIEDADLTGLDTDLYSFEWHQDTYPNVFGGNTAEETDLAAGKYFVVATELTTGCKTGVLEIDLTRDSEDPTIVFTTESIDTSCSMVANEGNGSLKADIYNEAGTLLTTDAATAAALFNFTWYAGIGTGGTDLADNTVIMGSDTWTISGLNGEDGKDYTVLVETIATGCTNTGTFKLEEEIPVISITNADYTLNPNNDCSPDFDGSIEITAIREDGSTVDGGSNPLIDFYTFTWAAVAGTGADLTGASISSTNGATDNKYDELPSGTYEVTASSDNRACNSETFQFVIDNDAAVPEVIFYLVQEDNDCSDGAGGSLTGTGILQAAVKIAGDTVTTGYSFTWTRGTDGAGADITAGAGSTALTAYNNGSRATGLSDGQYAVEVIDTNDADGSLNCSTIATTTVTESIDDVNILTADRAITPNNDCSPNFDGGISINNLTVNGATVTDLTGYTFNWTVVAGTGADLTGITPTDVNNGTDNVLAGLTAGTYEVTIDNANENCTGDGPFQFVIDNDAAVPEVIFYLVQEDNDC